MSEQEKSRRPSEDPRFIDQHDPSAKLHGWIEFGEENYSGEYEFHNSMQMGGWADDDWTAYSTSIRDEMRHNVIESPFIDEWEKDGGEWLYYWTDDDGDHYGTPPRSVEEEEEEYEAGCERHAIRIEIHEVSPKCCGSWRCPTCEKRGCGGDHSVGPDEASED